MKSVKKECSIEFEEKKSKFIGYIKPIQSVKEAEEFINEIKQRHTDASHNCSVYRVIEAGQEYFKADDDGEPSGTAGKPMAEILNYMEVYNLVVVATRYFGGVKLGAGGLVRNYAKTSKLAINEAGICEYVETKEFLIDFSYEQNLEIDQILKNNNIEIIEKNYGERITYRAFLSVFSEEEMKKINGIILIKL